MKLEGFKVSESDKPGLVVVSCASCAASWEGLELVEDGLSVGALQELRCHRDAHASGELPTTTAGKGRRRGE